MSKMNSGTNDNRYFSVIENMLDGYAHHKMVFDDGNKPVDYIFCEVNRAFERITGLDRKDIIGKKASQVLPKSLKGALNWTQVFSEVALIGVTVKMEHYIEALDIWLQLKAYSNEEGYFTVLFEDITLVKKREQSIRILSQASIRYLEFPIAHIDYRVVSHDIYKVSGALFTLVNLFKEDTALTMTKAVGGSKDNIRKVVETFGFDFIDKTWVLDEKTIDRITNNKIYRFENLEELCGKYFSLDIIERLKGKFSIGEIFSVTITHRKEVLGNIIIAMPKGRDLENSDIFELFANQLATIIVKKRAEKDLKLREELKEHGFKGSGDGIWDFNFSTMIFNMCNRSREMIGIGKTESINIFNEWKERLFPRDLKNILSEFNKVLKKGKQEYFMEFRIRNKDNDYLWFLSRGRIVSREPLRMVGTITDITHYKKLEQQIRTSEEKFRGFIENANDIIFSVNREGKFAYISPNASDIVGHKLEEIVGKHFDHFIHPNDLKMTMDTFNYVFNTGNKVSRVEYRIRHKNKSFIWLTANVSAIKDIEGKVLYFFGIARDITEQKNIEAKLKESEERWKFAVEGGGFGVVDTDLTTNSSYFSEQWADMLGYTKEEISNSNLEILKRIHPDDIGNAMAARERHLLGETPFYAAEYRMQCRDGSYKWILARAKVVSRDDNGKALRMVGTFLDITDRKNNEEKIKFLSYKDKLTELYNRAYFEEKLGELDSPHHYPISIVIGDVNGLKLTNDVFGHYEGDNLLMRISQIFKACCRREDVIARWGGDEFAIILPNTDTNTALKVCNRIANGCKNASDLPVQISISLGCATKYNQYQDVKEIITEAEENMYRHKLLESKSARSQILSSLQKSLFEKSHETQEHTNRMENLAVKLGRKIGLRNSEIDRLRLLSVLHDIGKIAISNDILNKKDKLTRDEWEEIKKHPEIGYRIADSSSELSHIASYILSHHERWDGKGYPQGLKGAEIPMLSRIISIVDAYDVMTGQCVYKETMSHQAALKEIKKCSGTQFDPDISKVFINMF